MLFSHLLYQGRLTKKIFCTWNARLIVCLRDSRSKRTVMKLNQLSKDYLVCRQVKGNFLELDHCFLLELSSGWNTAPSVSLTSIITRPEGGKPMTSFVSPGRVHDDVRHWVL